LGVRLAIAGAPVPPAGQRALWASSATRCSPRPCSFALVEADGEGCGDALPDGVAAALPDGVGVGVAGGVAELAAFGAISSTWRNSSSAVWLTSLTTPAEFWPGTDTVMMLVPAARPAPR